MGESSMAKYRNVKIEKRLLNSNLTHKEHDLILYTVSKNPDVAPISETVGLSKPSLSTEIAIYHDNNQK